MDWGHAHFEFFKWRDIAAYRSPWRSICGSIGPSAFLTVLLLFVIFKMYQW
jgi:hypothetical protein